MEERKPPMREEDAGGYDARLAKMLEREDSTKQGTALQEIVLDKTNKVSFPGYPYTFEAIGEKILVSVDIFKSGYECPLCQGRKVIRSTSHTSAGEVTIDIPCTSCKGQGAIIHIVESAKIRPVTGVVVSMGLEARERASYSVGDRILFGMHTGTMIPTKAGLAFKVMDWYAAMMVIEGADTMNAFDFILELT